MENGNSPRCDTIGCPEHATHVLTWRDRDDNAEYESEVCAPHGASYAARPALRATLAPMGGA
jgi:hypothetical protein